MGAVLEVPGPEARAAVSEKLATGLAVLTAALAVVAAYEGGGARVALNERGLLQAAVGLVLAGVLLGFVSSIAHADATLWLVAASASLVLTVVGVSLGTVAAGRAAVAYDKPQVTAEYDGETLTFTGTISLLPRDSEMRVTVHGYSAGCCDRPPPPGTRGEDRGSELFFTSTGPDPTGKAFASGKVPLEPGAFEQVEVRVYRSDRDPDCLRPVVQRQDRAACATVWTQPAEPGQP